MYSKIKEGHPPTKEKQNCALKSKNDPQQKQMRR
jgi:hypothetical protein